MTDITIPREALEAAAASICRDNGWPLSRLNACIPVARDACLAMLKAWPEMWKHPYTKCVILPLTENTNDKG